MDLPQNRNFNQVDFERLFKTEFKGLCFYALRYTKDFEISREIVQDSFATLWEKRSLIDPVKPVKSYLSTIVRNRCLNYLRDHRKFNHELLVIEGVSGNEEYEERDLLIEAEIRNKIQEGIRELPEKCREIFMMNRMDHMKYKEIAIQLGISVKTVETQMSKALQFLRIKLGEYLTSLVVLWIFLQMSSGY